VVNSHIFGEAANVRLLDLRIVKIVEVVEDSDGISRREQAFSEMGADETSPACNQDSHAATLATNGHRWTQILRPSVHARMPVATGLWPVRFRIAVLLTAHRAVATGGAT